MQIAVLTFDGFNELDSFVAAAILNRVKAKGWKAHITSPSAEVTSMNGITVQRQQPLEFARKADAVIIGSGVKTREIALTTTPEDFTPHPKLKPVLTKRQAMPHCCLRSSLIPHGN